ncbi:hydantoinase/oxoprolinase family protein [Methylomicrobium sp. Wu6]|uniref:hydantoinase/oxoprolinase family protein n=1 Tax=Methylomicrobium sp. Wu6 TaxID=3107928 RepID=UPI002DD68B35|nr:hydantoinase/oxoprolinase family protein [Methylomicrobium sp. Wu6]MEC4748980.1 hydantoinase/oxoprolinase family protein [Methylomicrobium sp. Wu6]
MAIEIIGWDIGGAHIKAAVLNARGELTAIRQKPCPLWQGLDKLRSAVDSIMHELPSAPYRHAITMTGELVDLFAGRDDGVKTIIETMIGLLPGADLLIYAGKLGFLNASKLDSRHYESIASANWLASASYAAQKIGRGLFIDIGSTTTDILLLDKGRVKAEGYSDYERLVTQELIYTGIVRTAVMAIAECVEDRDGEVGLMAEYFATMADVYRLTGELNEAHDQADTADGAEKTVFASARRLSRMVGCDFDPVELPRWQRLAENLRARQLQKIRRGCEKQLARGSLAVSIPFVGAGVGRFLVKCLADSIGYPYLDFSELFPAMTNVNGMTAADCAPAVAVASLARGY